MRNFIWMKAKNRTAGRRQNGQAFGNGMFVARARCAATGREESGLFCEDDTRAMGGSGRRVRDEQDVRTARPIVAPKRERNYASTSRRG